MSAGWVLSKIFQHLIVMYVFFFRYFYGKIQQKRAELDSSLGVRNS